MISICEFQDEVLAKYEAQRKELYNRVHPDEAHSGLDKASKALESKPEVRNYRAVELPVNKEPFDKKILKKVGQGIDNADGGVRKIFTSFNQAGQNIYSATH